MNNDFITSLRNLFEALKFDWLDIAINLFSTPTNRESPSR